MKTKNAPKRMTILLVDDHEDTRAAMKDWLEVDGYTVLDAPDKKNGLAIGLKHTFDILICDLQLADGNGWDLMIQLREKKPVVGIAMSGHCAPADFAHSKAAGFITHLVKPTPADEMETALATARREIKRSNTKIAIKRSRPQSAW